MTFQSKIGTSLPPEREPVRVSLALLINTYIAPNTPQVYLDLLDLVDL